MMFYRKIFPVVCVESRGLPYDEQMVIYLLQEYYVKRNQKLRANHPRDLVDQMEDIVKYREIPFSSF